MKWKVAYHQDFEAEFLLLEKPVQQAILATIDVLTMYGPQLGRPLADTLKGSTYANMKELRISADDGVWRVAYVFDPNRNAITLVAGNKAGVNQKRFYSRLIATADARYAEHLKILNKGPKK